MYVPTLSPIDANPRLRAYLEREFQAIGRAVNEGPYEPADVRGYGTEADGATDDSAAFIEWGAAATDNSYLFGRGTFRVECTVSDPGTGDPNQHGVLFTGKTGLVIDLSAATLVQTTSNVLNGGIIALKDCVDCTVYVNGSGVNGATISNSSAATVALIGDCRGCRVYATQRDGGRGAVIVRSSDLTGAGDRPSNCEVWGYAEDSWRGVIATHVGAGMSYRVFGKDNGRTFFVDGNHGPGRAFVHSIGSVTSGLRLHANGAGAVIEGLEIDAELIDCVEAQLSLACSAASGEQSFLRDIKIRGYGNSVAGSAGAVELTQFEDAASECTDLDLSGYKVRFEAAGSSAVTIAPDDASAVIRRLKLPDVVTDDTADANVVTVANTVGATIDGVTLGNVDAGSAAGSWVCAVFTGSAIKNVDLSNKRFFQAGGSASFSVGCTVGDGVNALGAVSNRVFNFVGATRVVAAPSRQLASGVEGPRYAGTIADNQGLWGIDTILVSSGTPTINTLRGGVNGQRVTFVSTGGTPTFAHNTSQIRIKAGANKTLTASNDAITLVCVDEAASPQVWQEVAQ